MMYVQEYTGLLDELADRWINPAHIVSIQPSPSDQLLATTEDSRCEITLTDRRKMIVRGGCYAMQSWWWDHVRMITEATR